MNFQIDVDRRQELQLMGEVASAPPHTFTQMLRASGPECLPENHWVEVLERAAS